MARRKRSELKTKTKPTQAPADLRQRLTAKQMFRGPDPIAMAFLHVENLQQKRTRKLTRGEWKTEFEKFRAEERR